MATILAPPEIAAQALRKKRFTRQEVEQMLDSGIFVGQRWELLDGELIEKMGQNPPHAAAIRALPELLRRLVGNGVLQVQLPIEAGGEDRDRSVPEPDVAVLRQDKPEFKKRHPRGDELLLAIEVSDSSAAFDLSRKAALYAKAGVPEYWVLDLIRRALVVHRQSDGVQYRRVEIRSGEDLIALEGGTESIAVHELLPE